MLFNGVFGLSVISELTAVLYKVFLCVAVHKDAREHDDKNAVLWTVLTVLFGLLPVIIYAILRYNKSKDFILCPHCGKMVSAKYPVCMFCKQPVNDAPKRDFISEDVKKYLILAAVLFVVDLVVKNIVSLSSAGNNITISLF